MSIAVKRPIPGYITLKAYEVKRRVGNWSIASQDPESSPEIGTVLAVGPVLTKMPYDPKDLPVVGDIVVYKKYNAFKLPLEEEVIAVHFENILLVVEETTQQDNVKN